jgi:hypothetical protein
MRMMLAAGVLTGLLALLCGGSAQAREYPWCAFYGGIGGMGIGSSTYNCGFVSWEQCMATISGVGGVCRPNPRYVPPPPRRKTPPRKPPHRQD